MSIRKDLYLKRKKLKRALQRWRFGNCTVLLYHRIANATYDPQQLCVSPENFKMQLQYLKKRYHFLTVEEFDDHLINRKPFKRNSLLITFDDGYADNLKNAIPILENEQLQALFYISIHNLNNQSIFWWDELDLIFKYPEKIDSKVLNQLFKNTNVADVNSLYNYYLTKLKRASSLREREDYLGEVRMLRVVLEEERKEYYCLTYDECITMGNSKAAIIGAHSINHLSLAALSNSDQEHEITESVMELSKIIKKRISYFSYPYGEKHDYNEFSEAVCKKLNLNHAAANYGGYMDCISNKYAFTRFVVRNDLPEILDNKLRAIL